MGFFFYLHRLISMIKYLKCTRAGFEVQIFPVQFSGQREDGLHSKWLQPKEIRDREKEREQGGGMGRKHKPSILWDLKPHYVPWFWEHSSKCESWIWCWVAISSIMKSLKAPEKLNRKVFLIWTGQHFS